MGSGQCFVHESYEKAALILGDGGICWRANGYALFERRGYRDELTCDIGVYICVLKRLVKIPSAL
jgi:hypothetical protein